MVKQLSLFSNEETIIQGNRKSDDLFFDDYESFVNKFKNKKTTDDCYTPEKVYNAILSWLSENVDLSGKQIVRPFYPGGDYLNEYYTENSVVIDNPPFSILSQIISFYTERRIAFFLFAPHLTIFSAIRNKPCTAIIIGSNIIYDNEAKVTTSFISNMLGDLRAWGCPELAERIADTQEKQRALPKYIYPDNVLTSTMIEKNVKKGIEIKLKKSESHFITQLESQKMEKKTIFGCGLLISDKVAKTIKAYDEIEKKIEWGLSKSERKIIEGLNKNNL